MWSKWFKLHEIKNDQVTIYVSMIHHFYEIINIPNDLSHSNYWMCESNSVNFMLFFYCTGISWIVHIYWIVDRHLNFVTHILDCKYRY